MDQDQSSQATPQTPPAQQPAAPAPVPQPTPAASPAPAPQPTPVVPESAPAPSVSPVPTTPAPEPAPSATPASEPVPHHEELESEPVNEHIKPADTPAPAPTSSSAEKKILLVEDDDALANVYMTRLKAEGFNIKRVPNGEDAITSAVEFRPDLILLDVMMPKVSGFDVLDIIRNTPGIGNAKVIMLTALSQDTDIQRAKDLGADDYLVKSQVVIADVVDRIKHHLDSVE